MASASLAQGLPMTVFLSCLRDPIVIFLTVMTGKTQQVGTRIAEGKLNH